MTRSASKTNLMAAKQSPLSPKLTKCQVIAMDLASFDGKGHRLLIKPADQRKH